MTHLQVIPFLTLVVWLGLIIYLVALLSRLVRATEEIAAVLSAGCLERRENDARRQR